ncbi:MAG TPA: tetratricopeptide repeat protein, partial [Myxococcales bacterium]|nr:tetratricopeptide repeat protein [Myxococcales bacterium]
VGSTDGLSPHIMEVLGSPQAWARGVAAMAAGVREAKGSQEAADIVLDSTNLDLTSPVHAAALSSLVTDLVPLGRGSEVLSRTESALSLHPQASALYAVRGQALTLTGADRKEIRAAWARALELNPGNAKALRGLAGLEVADGEADAALALYRRAALAEPEDGEALGGAAKVLIAEGRFREAQLELERLLERDPYDGVAALQLAELLLKDKADSARLRTRALLRKAERFGGGPEASRLLSAPIEPEAVQAL